MKNMKKIVALALVLTMVFALAACGSKSEPKDRLAKIKEQGYIEMVTEPYFAPFEFIDPSKEGDAQYVGMDIELGKKIAEKIGVELKIVPLEFSAVLAGVVDGKYDMAISAIAYSPSREEAMLLSDGYKLTSNEGYGFLTRIEDADKYTCIEDLANAVVATQSGSVQEGIYNDQVKSCKEFKLVSAMTDGYLAVAENKADVCIVSKASAKLYAEANGGLAVSEFTFETDPKLSSTVVGVPKGGESLMAVVNEVIAEQTANGNIEAWYAEYEALAASLGVS